MNLRPSILQADLTLTSALAPFSYIVVIRANYHAIVAARCHAFFAAACKRVSPAINHREWATGDEGRSEVKKRRKRSAVCTRVIRKRQPPRAAWALSSKNKQNVAPRHGLTRVYIVRIADIAGRFSPVLSFSLAVIPFQLLLSLSLSLFWFSPSLSFSLQKNLD